MSSDIPARTLTNVPASLVPAMEQDRIVEDKLSLAVLYFKSANFKKALQQYNEIIKSMSSLPMETIISLRTNKYKLQAKPLIGTTIHPKLCSALDQRAATFQKLNQYQRALRDAEQIIKLEPLSCKGYLRAGKNMIILKNELDAYKVYQRGIYTIEKAIKEYQIKVPESLFKELKSQYTELNRKLKSEKSKSLKPLVDSGIDSRLQDMLPHKRSGSALESSSSSSRRRISQRRIPLDPFTSLPSELLELVFRNFKLKFVLQCFLVCKNWHHTLTELPSLFVGKAHFKQGVTHQEFVSGVKLIKNISHKTHSQQIKSLRLSSTLNLPHLKKVLEIIVAEPNFAIISLDVYNKYFNFQLFLQALSKFNWRFNNFQNVQSLRWGINSSFRCEQVLLKLFKNLKVLNIVVLLPELSSSANGYIPKSDKRYRMLVQNEEELEASPAYPTMESLVLINHPKLISNEMKMTDNNDTFNPYPPFLNKNFPNLIELNIASFDFKYLLPKLGLFLLNTPNLKKIALENNENFSVLEFLQLLKNYNPGFQLSKLTFREKSVNSSVSMNAFSLSDLGQLHSLSLLDINGSSLTCNGFLKLLRIVNTKGNLTDLSFGSSNYLKFKTDVFGIGRNNSTFLHLYSILEVVPSLTKLFIHDLELDNHTMKQFHADIKKFGFSRCKLKVMDISFSKVEGIGLIDLFCAVPSNIKRISDNELYSDAFRLEELVIDGIEVNQGTLSSLKKNNFVKVIKADVNKKRWRQFGLNSFVIQA